jgi:hypothetical protein
MSEALYQGTPGTRNLPEGSAVGLNCKVEVGLLFWDLPRPDRGVTLTCLSGPRFQCPRSRPRLGPAVGDTYRVHSTFSAMHQLTPS